MLASTFYSFGFAQESSDELCALIFLAADVKISRSAAVQSHYKIPQLLTPEVLMVSLSPPNPELDGLTLMMPL